MLLRTVQKKLLQQQAIQQTVKRNFSKSERQLQKVLAKQERASPPPPSGFGRGWNIGLILGTSLGFFLLPKFLKNEKSEDDDEKSENKEDAKSEKAVDGAAESAPKKTKKPSYKDRFNAFADVDKNGEKHMSPEAFIRSLLSPRPDAPAWVAYPRNNGKLAVDDSIGKDPKLKLMISLADSDGDGVISYSEYCLFLTLLGCSDRQFQIAFKMFDLDGSGTISKDEFKNVLKANTVADQIQIANNTPLMTQFFGQDGKKQLSFEQFHSFIKGLKEEILKQEFNQHDVERRGLISVESFSELVTTSVHFNSLTVPAFKRHLNILKTKGFFRPSGRIDYETFRSFHIMSQNLDDIGIAIQLYTAAGNSLNKQAFKRALERVAELKISDRVVDMVFAIFDQDGDGNLQYDEFIEVMKNRKSGKNYSVPLDMKV